MTVSLLQDNSKEKKSRREQKEQAWIPVLEEEEVEDDHEVQSFAIPTTTNSLTTTTAIRLVFDECTDFYGRVTVYELKVLGYEYEKDKTPQHSM